MVNTGFDVGVLRIEWAADEQPYEILGTPGRVYPAQIVMIGTPNGGSAAVGGVR